MFKVMEALRAGVTGKIIDVTINEEDNEHVEIYAKQPKEFDIGA